MSTVEICGDCGGALAPCSERPPCLCRLQPVVAEAAVPERAGTTNEAAALKCPSCGAFLETGVRRCQFCRVELASVRCWCCFELSFAGTGHCARCGSTLGVEGDLGPTEQQCPGCGQDVLHLIDVGVHRVRECPACAGLLLDHATFEAITHARESGAGERLRGGATRSVLSVAGPIRYRKCPTCDKIMNRRNFGRSSGVIIDICAEHGVWFDPDELTAVLEFVATGGLAESRARDAQRAKQDLARYRMNALAEQTRMSRADGAAPFSSTAAFVTALTRLKW